VRTEDFNRGWTVLRTLSLRLKIPLVREVGRCHKGSDPIPGPQGSTIKEPPWGKSPSRRFLTGVFDGRCHKGSDPLPGPQGSTIKEPPWGESIPLNLERGFFDGRCHKGSDPLPGPQDSTIKEPPWGRVLPVDS